MRASLLAAVLVAALIPVTARPAELSSLRLDAAVKAALERNPAVTAARARQELAGARLREARALWLPRIDATETIMRSDNPVFVFGSLLEQGRFGARNFDPAFLNDPDPLTNFRLAVSVRYPLFDQFRRLNTVRQGRNAVEQADFGSEEMRQRIRLETVSRFYALLLAIERRKVASEAVTSAEADTASMAARYEQGVIVESDLMAAEVQLAAFRQQLIEAGGELEIARAALATLIQRPLNEPFQVEGRITETALPDLDLDEAVARAVRERGEVKSAQRATESAALQLRTVRASFLPQVDTFATWGQSGAALTGGGSDSAIGLVIGAALFDPGKGARVSASRAELQTAQSEEVSARDRITMEVVTAWYRVSAAKEQIGVAARSVERASSAARIVSERYQNGLSTIAEHLRAQTSLLSTRQALLAARFHYVSGYAELLRSTGGLNDVEDFD